MKFGQYLKSQIVPKWSFYYMSYNKIKKDMENQQASTESEMNRYEKSYLDALDRELDKINSFYLLESGTLYNRVLQVKASITEGKKDASIDKELDDIAQTLVQLEAFQRLNLLAFHKLLKKHDKHRGVPAKAWYMLRVEEQPFVKKDGDHILMQLSESWKLLNKIRTQQVEKKRELKEEALPSSQNFERKTTKYWVRGDKVTLIKSMISKHLPIDVFDKTVERSSNLTTSVYYDSPDLLLYHERLKKEEGAISIRMRTYGEGGQKNKVVFVERKTHHDSWIGEASVKTRFAIKEKFLYPYCRGKYTLEEKLNKLEERKEMSSKEINDTRILSTEIQDSILSLKLQPSITTRYYRTAFQLGRDDSVRISLDTDLNMVLEKGYEGNRWGRDLSVPLEESEITHFPFAILEVKLNLKLGDEAPEWIASLINSDLVIPVPKFSKFMHGTAILQPEKVKLLPAWLDLLKSLQQEPTFDYWNRVRVNVKYLKYNSFNSKYGKLEDKLAISPSNKTSTSPSNHPSFKRKSVKNEEVIPIPMSPNSSGRALELLEVKVPNESIDVEGAPLLINSDVSDVGKFRVKSKSKAKGHGCCEGCWNCGSWKDKIKNFFGLNKKPSHMPMRVEPKTFFANERTLLHWLSYLVLIQSVGIALIRFAPGTNRLYSYGGLAFVLLSLLYMVYVVFRYDQRRRGIVNRVRGPYEDKWGPMILVLFVIAAVVFNIVLLYKFYFVHPCTGKSLIVDQRKFYAYAPSDVMWNAETHSLYLTGLDMLTELDPKDSSTKDYLVGGNYTAVTIAGKSLFLGKSYPPSVDEFDTHNSSIIRSFPLPLPGTTASAGLEGLTFVPIENYPNGGVFWAASGADKSIYIFNITLNSNKPSNASTVTLVRSFQPIKGISSLQSLYYHSESQLIYGTGGHWLFSLTKDGTLNGYWALGFPNPSGVSIVGKGDSLKAFIACDTCGDIWEFSFHPKHGFGSGQCWPPSTTNAPIWR